MKEIIKTAKAPKAVGPYSQAVRAGGFIFISGQLPIDPNTGEIVAGGAGEQTRQSIKNIEQILKAASLSLNDVVKTTVYICCMKDFAEMNAAYSEFFKEDCPARSAAEVSALAKGAIVEIDAIAVCN